MRYLSLQTETEDQLIVNFLLEECWGREEGIDKPIYTLMDPTIKSEQDGVYELLDPSYFRLLPDMQVLN